MLLLEIQACLKYPDFDLDISTTINNETAGIFGHSGSGKSTLLHLISGLRRPDYGRIVLNGNILFNSSKNIFIPPEKRNVGVVFQEGNLFPHMTVEKNLMYGAKRRKKDAPDICSVINILGIKKLLQRYPENLSGGERQRVAIGRALLCGPEILLMDEPFSAIDVNMRRELLPFITKLHAEFNLPILLISHDLPDILQITNYLLVLENGKLLAKGTCSELIFDNNCGQMLCNSGARSCFTGIISKTNTQTGISTISCHNVNQNVDVFVPYQSNIKENEIVRAQIAPQDIILSAAPVEYISAQNQLKGIISRINRIGERTIVEINIHGLKLLAEITTKASHDFPYIVGNPIWALFKAWALNYNHCKADCKLQAEDSSTQNTETNSQAGRIVIRQ